MASPQAFTDMSNTHRVSWVVDGSDRTTLAAIPVTEAGVTGTWFNMRDYDSILAICILHSRTDNIEQFHLYAGTSSAGAGAAAIVTHAGTTGADAAGDGVILEISAEQIVQEGSDAGVEYTHIAPYVKTGNSSDRVTCILIGKSKRPRRALSADYSA
jgi:hypothetical protein